MKSIPLSVCLHVLMQMLIIKVEQLLWLKQNESNNSCEAN